MENEIDPLVEWAVWGHLDSKTDLELILLKGHLLMEMIMDTALGKNNTTNYKNYSFYKKISILETVDFNDNHKKELIISSLKTLNNLRNKLSHEFQFDINKGELEQWASKILENLRGMKFSKYTYRTKIVHSFSILSINLLELTN
ncbi:MAG: hypothetical protein NTY07_05790 [Bacteroidia bacterium]|nr:hypothetical protein [Bacteroidia bacterium]